MDTSSHSLLGNFGIILRILKRNIREIWNYNDLVRNFDIEIFYLVGYCVYEAIIFSFKKRDIDLSNNIFDHHF